MSLDQNLFTLVVTPLPENPQVVDLVEPSKGQAYYRKQRVPGPTYRAEVYDVNSESLLVVASAPSATSKTKTLELQNPTAAVELKYTGTLTFKWSFKWEEHDFEWRREECFLIRKPDPAVLVAITKEPAGKLKTSSIQLLDYNLNRFEIRDRKGLELVILTALLTFNDANEAYHDKSPSGTPSTKSKNDKPPTPTNEPPPPLPSKPPAKSGVDRIAEIQALRSEVNEVNVEDEGKVEDYAQYCFNLLQDDAMLFITVKSADAIFVPKVLQVVEETKRLRYKNGLADDEFHQYVAYDQSKKKGPRRINLDVGEEQRGYEPPSSISIHLSKIAMPELQPKSSPLKPTTPSPSPSSDNPKDKKEKKKAEKSPPSGKITKHSSSRVHSHQAHPAQPSPSPSQLNNPAVYAAPPPPPSLPSNSKPSSGLLNSALGRLHIPSGLPNPSGNSASNSPSLSGMLDRFRR